MKWLMAHAKVASMNWLSSACLLVVMMLCSGCTQPEGSAGAAAEAYLSAVVERDATRVYPLLDSGTHKAMDELFKTFVTTHELIQKHYDGEAQKKAMRATRADVVVNLKRADALFSVLMMDAGVSTELSTLESWGLAIRSVDESAGIAKVQTIAGDTIELVQEGSRWAVKLSTDDLSRLQSIKARAEKDLSQIQADLRAIKSKRFGAGNTVK